MLSAGSLFTNDGRMPLSMSESRRFYFFGKIRRNNDVTATSNLSFVLVGGCPSFRLLKRETTQGYARTDAI